MPGGKEERKKGKIFLQQDYSTERMVRQTSRVASFAMHE